MNVAVVVTEGIKYDRAYNSNQNDRYLVGKNEGGVLDIPRMISKIEDSAQSLGLFGIDEDTVAGWVLNSKKSFPADILKIYQYTEFCTDDDSSEYCNVLFAASEVYDKITGLVRICERYSVDVVIARFDALETCASLARGNEQRELAVAEFALLAAQDLFDALKPRAGILVSSVEEDDGFFMTDAELPTDAYDAQELEAAILALLGIGKVEGIKPIIDEEDLIMAHLRSFGYV